MKSPYNIEAIRRRRSEPTRFTSYGLATPSPVIDLEDDFTGLKRFELPLVDLSTTYMQTGDPKLAEMLIGMLYEWAMADACLGTVSKQGVFERNWFLGSIASSYVKLQPPAGDGSSYYDRFGHTKIEEWIDKMATAVCQNFNSRPELNSRHNNHRNWAGWSVLIAAVATQDEDGFDWAIDAYVRGVRQIQEDGTLPLELARDDRAAHYHVFALEPLVMLAETLTTNQSVNSYELYGGALHRLVELATKILLQEETVIDQLVETPQDRTNTMHHLGWVEPYYRRFPSSRLESLLKHRPLHSMQMGGDMTMLFAYDAAACKLYGS